VTHHRLTHLHSGVSARLSLGSASRGAGLRRVIVRGERQEDMLSREWHTKYATISDCGIYRYFLGRTRGEGPICTFIMLNPSVADAERDDPTIRKCMGFAERWGCGQLSVVNLFAVRATNPIEVLAFADPVGPLSKRYFDFAINAHVSNHAIARRRIGPLVCGWGVHGGYLDRDLEVTRWIDNWPGARPVCLGFTKDGHPRHPLYAPYDTPVVPYRGRRWTVR
jgi:hypothetical protein